MLIHAAMNSGEGPLARAELAAVTDALKVLLLLSNRTAAQGEAAQVRAPPDLQPCKNRQQKSTVCLPQPNLQRWCAQRMRMLLQVAHGSTTWQLYNPGDSHLKHTACASAATPVFCRAPA